MSAFGGKADMTLCGAKTRGGNPKKDQVEETRRVLREMWDKADRAIDDQTAVKITRYWLRPGQFRRILGLKDV
jgi:hypothetical protein